jgi:ribosomal protein L11 methylase PrmA
MNAIVQNKHIFKDKVVLDVGCGTAILSMCVYPRSSNLLSSAESTINSKREKKKRNIALA